VRTGKTGTDLDMVERAIERRHAAWPERAARIEVGHARLILVAIAAWVGACDLAVKVIEPARSGIVTLGAGLMIGGGIGNALSIAIFPLGVPDPFTIARSDWMIAFNLADFGVATGFLLAIAGVWVLALDRRPGFLVPIERRRENRPDGYGF
jgi:hypothetical protein